MDGTKYIGMDVHKESISIAVMNSAGKVVMECVILTKANMILQFVAGLRGELRFTFEEGTWAAWLYDLLRPHVTKIVVCNPRRNALLKDGNKNDRIDAQKLAELLYLNKLKPVYHGEHGLRAVKELVRSYLTITRDFTRVMTRVKALYRSWAIPCTGQASLWTAPSCGVAGEDYRAGCASPRRVLLPTTRCSEDLASGRTAGVVEGEQEAQGLEAALPDSLNRPDPGGHVDGHPANSASLPHQETAMDLQWVWH